MDRNELITDIADKMHVLNYNKFDIKTIIEEFLRQIKNSVAAGDTVVLHEFGTFKNHLRSERTIITPTHRKQKKPAQIIAVKRRYSIEFIVSPFFVPTTLASVD